MTLATSRLQRIPEVTVLVAPEPFLELPLAKMQLKIEHDESDPLLQTYIDAALANLDGPGSWLGRAIAPQTLQLAVFEDAEAIIQLPYPPIIAVESITYDDPDGEPLELADDLWRHRRGCVQAVSGSWPALSELRIRYRAGYLPVGEESPYVEPREVKRCRVAAMMLVADFNRNREAQLPDPGVVENQAVCRLLNTLRVIAIG